MALLGVDVFEGDGVNGEVDWHKASAHGVRFGWIKLTEGDYTDKTATSARVSAMRTAGIIPGGYVFLRPKAGRNGAWEARRGLDQARKVGLYHKDKGAVRDLRFALDFEATAFPDTRVGRYRTRRYLRQAIDEVVRQLGRRPIIYSGAWFADPIGVSPSTVRGCPLWVASYTAHPIVPKGWPRADFWQFTDSEDVPGVGKCDANHYLAGDLAHLRKNHTI